VRRLAGLWLLVNAVLAPLAVSAQGDPHVPAQAQPALQRGVAAAKAQDWSTAIAELSRAQKLAPHAPIVLFNLGLAYDRSGRPFPAIGWLRAYVESAPREGNVTEVMLRIAILKSDLVARERDVFQRAMQTAGLLKRDYHTILNIVSQEIRAGEFDRVEEILSQQSGVSRRELQDLRDRMYVQQARIEGLKGYFDAAQEPWITSVTSAIK
jgi:Tfp pilus assembly protein PilF